MCGNIPAITSNSACFPHSGRHKIRAECRLSDRNLAGRFRSMAISHLPSSGRSWLLGPGMPAAPLKRRTIQLQSAFEPLQPVADHEFDAIPYLRTGHAASMPGLRRRDGSFRQGAGPFASGELPASWGVLASLILHSRDLSFRSSETLFCSHSQIAPERTEISHFRRNRPVEGLHCGCRRVPTPFAPAFPPIGKAGPAAPFAPSCDSKASTLLCSCPRSERPGDIAASTPNLYQISFKQHSDGR